MSEVVIMTNKEYEEVLLNHDWTYQMSCDWSKYATGLGSMMTIQKYKNASPKHTELYLQHFKSVEM